MTFFSFTQRQRKKKKPEQRATKGTKTMAQQMETLSDINGFKPTTKRVDNKKQKKQKGTNFRSDFDFLKWSNFFEQGVRFRSNSSNRTQIIFISNSNCRTEHKYCHHFNNFRTYQFEVELVSSNISELFTFLFLYLHYM